MTEATWRVRRATGGDRDRALALMQQAFGGTQPAGHAAARWDWLFSQNTAARRYFYLVADAGDVLAAQYALLPTRMQHAGRPLLGLLSLDTATHPRFERQGLFTSLARQLYQESSAECPLVYGFPNENSAPGFYRRLDWRPVVPYPWLVRPLGRWRRIASSGRRTAALFADLVAAPALAAFDRAALPSDAGVEPFADFGEWADATWRANAPRLGTCAVRDRAFLQWRYVEAPFDYERLALVRGGEVRGFAVLAFSALQRGIMAHLMEVMTADPDDAASAAALVAASLRLARSREASAVSTIATARHPHRAVLRRCGFLQVPARFSGARSFGFRVNGALEGGADALARIDTWYLSGSDLDFV